MNVSKNRVTQGLANIVKFYNKRLNFKKRLTSDQTASAVQ